MKSFRETLNESKAVIYTEPYVQYSEFIRKLKPNEQTILVDALMMNNKSNLLVEFIATVESGDKDIISINLSFINLTIYTENQDIIIGSDSADVYDINMKSLAKYIISAKVIG